MPAQLVAHFFGRLWRSVLLYASPHPFAYRLLIGLGHVTSENDKAPHLARLWTVLTRNASLQKPLYFLYHIFSISQL
jgi:hypothetical protein